MSQMLVLPVPQHIPLPTLITPTYPPRGTCQRPVQESWTLNPCLPSTLASGLEWPTAIWGREGGHDWKAQGLGHPSPRICLRSKAV